MYILQLYRVCSPTVWLAWKTKMKHAFNAKSFIHGTNYTDAERSWKQPRVGKKNCTKESRNKNSAMPGIWNRCDYRGEFSWNGHFVGLNAFIILINIEMRVTAVAMRTHITHSQLQCIAPCCNRNYDKFLLEQMCNSQIRKMMHRNSECSIWFTWRCVEPKPNQCTHVSCCGNSSFHHFLPTIYSHFLFLSIFFLSTVRTVDVQAVEGNRISLPCPLVPPSRDKVYMVLWFRDDAGIPLYR